ncbi:NACHT domain-containing protein [Mycobacteroides abscessus]
MTSDWALEELGPRAFEQFSVALAAQVIGPDVQVYGSGKDGGREATYEGLIDWPHVGGEISCGPERAWTGYTVVQAKQRERLVSLSSDLSWIKQQIRDELNSWSTGTRSRLPNNLLFVTNVRLSANDEVGGVDQLVQFTDAELDRERQSTEGRGTTTLRTRGLSNVFVWHRDILNALISIHGVIRDAFPALLTVGDILTRLAAMPGKIDPEYLAPILIGHAQSSLRHEQWLRFDEAGDSPEARHPIDKVIFDLPARHDGSRTKSVLDRIFRRADQVTRKSVWNSEHPRHLVITGAPGNGKSTLSQYLTQVYRARFAEREANEASVTALIKRTHESLERLGVAAPASIRWPLRIELAKMAADMGPSGGSDIKRWLAERITERAGLEIQPATLDSWIKASPTLLVFDGLDEVTAPALRQRVMDEITSLLERADATDADLLLVVTTRRTGYTERMLPQHFDQIDLDYLTVEEAIEYGRYVTNQRLVDDAPHRDLVLARFENATKDPAMERLVQTPLQVLILTIILGSTGTLPTTRYRLFWTYYETVFKREAEKNTTYRSFFQDHRSALTDLHQLVGLQLQMDCESTGEVHARMPRAQLQSLAKQYMIDEGHEESAANTFAATVFTVATQRLVLLATDIDDTVSFDVRSLQELMAGCALVDGDDTAISTNLTTTAFSPHWRNAWLFAAGRLFDGSRHRRDLLLEIVEHSDERGHWPSWLYPAAPELAAYLLEDGLAAAKPNDQRRLIDVALRSLNGPIPQEPQTLALGLRIASTLNRLHSAHIRNAIATAHANGGVRQAIARMLMYYERYGSSRVPGNYTEKDLERSADMWRFQLPRVPERDQVTVADLLAPHFAELASCASREASALVDDALTDCEQLTMVRTDRGDLWPVVSARLGEWPKLSAALQDSDSRELLQVCLGAVSPGDWAATSLLSHGVAASAARQPISGRLKTDMPQVDTAQP